MATQERIIELVDDKGEEISSTVVTSEPSIKTKTDFEKLSIKSGCNVDSESGDSVPFEDEDEDDDVPSDFFDDFSNQDFMAGLDVVDAWDDDEATDDKQKAKKADATHDPKRRTKYRHADKARRRRSRSPIRSNYRSRDHYDRRRRSKDRFRTSKDRFRWRRSRDAKSKEKPKEAVAENKRSEEEGELDGATLDHRRDPEKTKRDIQKDKDKCAKDKEAKIISEKLKVVETGLVPPGTEMEVDLKQLKTTVVKEAEKKTAKPSVREDRRRRSKSTSMNIYQNRVPYRERRYSPIPRRSNYERRLPLKRSRSPYRGRSRTRSPPRRRVSSDKKIFIEERRRIRHYRDPSPTVIKRRSKDRSLELSPISNLSEREMWLRRKEPHRIRYISCSPVSDADSSNRKRSRGFLEELANKLKSDKKKKSFLKEIQQRLNEPSQPHPNYSHRAPGPVPSPIAAIPTMPGQVHVPVPGFMPTVPPPYFPQQLDPAPQYDQQFFIGQPDVYHNPNLYQPPYVGHVAGPGVVGPMHGEMFSPPAAPGTVVAPHPIHSPLSQTNYNVNLLKIQQAAEVQKEKDKEAITKLFEDKKISLSDFLSMSAKHADPTKPVNVQKKVKVISLCQDAKKALGGDSKLTGRFFLKKSTREAEKPPEAKFQSPLRKIPVIRFNFTTPSRSGDDKSSLQTTLHKVLASLGFTDSGIPVVPKPSPSPVTSEASIKSVPTVTRQQPTTPVKSATRRYDPILGAKFQMKMCQTDPVKCHICEIRKSRKVVDQSVQCEISTIDSGTQITDEDLLRMGIKVPMKDALKNQSLAHLTPAQLLARTAGQEESPKKNLFPAARMLTPPPPDISPEKQNVRASLSNNDSFPNRTEYPDRYKPDPFNNHNTPNRSSGYKAPSIFDKVQYNKRSKKPFDNRPKPFKGVTQPRSNVFDNRSSVGMHQETRFSSTSGFNQRMQDDDDEEDDFEPEDGNYGNNTNQGQFVSQNRGNFVPGPYGGRNYF